MVNENHFRQTKGREMDAKASHMQQVDRRNALKKRFYVLFGAERSKWRAPRSV